MNYYLYVKSVNLFVKNDLALLDGCVIGLTSQSASSALLVKVMCHHFWRVNATYHVMKDPSEWRNHDAFLLIGDDCLLTPTIPGYITIDLAAAWYQETQLPFTFAIFAARKEVMQDSPAEIQSFLQAMQASYAWSKDNSEAIYKLARQRLPSLSVETLDEYYRTIKYELSDRQLQGMTLFHELANALPTEPEAAYARL
jgi:predicted solute-binding protein